MKSMKLYMPVLLLGLVSFMTGTLAAQNGHLVRDGQTVPFPATACNPNPFNITGNVDVVYHRNGNHQQAHFSYHGTGTDNATGITYTFSFDANAQDPAVYPLALPAGMTIYTFPYHATFAGQGTSTFHADGMVAILVVNGVLTDEGVISVDSCSAN